MAGCPDKAPFLCGNKTLSRGLCVQTEADCSTRSDSIRNIPKTPENALGKKYGYTDEPSLGRHCYFSQETLILNYTATFDDGEEVPPTFSCLTYNIWGLAKNVNLEKLFRLRKSILETTIRKTDADLLCLQEMSTFSYGELEGLIREYKFASEVPYPHPKGTPLADRNRKVDTYFLSKYKPSAIHLYSLPGVLGYSNCFMIIEYKNLIIFNLYNQAGSIHSPGQTHKWIHYSRCRYDILQTIWNIIQSKYPGQNVIICGDFNFHLDGSIDEWPEMEMIHTLKANGFIDTFRSVNPELPGFTEDTDLNLMRWNQKLIEKHLRYDCILFRGAWKPTSSEIMGTEESCLTPEDSTWFIDNMSEAKEQGLDKLRPCKGGHIREGESIRLPINPSDHFGVITKFSMHAKGGRRKSTRRQRGKSRKIRVRRSRIF